VDETEALERVRERAAAMKAPDRSQHGEVEATIRRHGERRVVRQDVGEAYLGLSFPAPSVRDLEGVLALDVALTILGDGRSSRLVQEVREKRHLASTVSAGAPTHCHDSLAFAMATCEPGKEDAVEEAILQVLDHFAQEGPTEGEMAKARRILRNSHAYSTETNSGHSSMTGYSWALTGDGTLAETYLDLVANLSADQARQAVGRILAEAGPGGHNRVVLLPKEPSAGAAS
jgi:predicted Zn-dependent peptidase